MDHTSEAEFDATTLVHQELVGERFIDGAALGAALGYTKPRLARFWKRIERAEAGGRLGYVMWRRRGKRVVGCLLCGFSALRIAIRTRSSTAIAVSNRLAELMSSSRRAEFAEREAVQEAVARTQEMVARLEERVAQKKLELECTHANTLPPANEPATEVAALRARLLLVAEAKPGAGFDAEEIKQAQIYVAGLDGFGPAGRTWWRKDGCRRLAYAAKLRRLLTTYHCPLRAMKSQVFVEMCDTFSWGGKDRPWRLLPADWVWLVHLHIDMHIDESLERLEAAREQREQRHTA